MKLIVAERGSTALRDWFDSSTARIFSGDLMRTEFVRAVRRSVPGREALARDIMGSILLVRMSATVCDRAALIEPRSLRSLDALHLAAALEAGDELEGILTYDDRLADAAKALGINVVAPGSR